MENYKNILLIVSGGIAAYKSAELVRQLRHSGAKVRCILTKAGNQFITPLTLSALSGEKVYQDLFSLTDEAEMGHIRLSREADIVVVAPASADLIARMSSGVADDLATTALLATDKPVLLAPSMNGFMWDNPITKRNISILETYGINIIGPHEGDLACGENGYGRMAEPNEIVDEIDYILGKKNKLRGLHALVTSGPTQEPIDPVRYISNYSSGKQGHAIAQMAAFCGAKVTLVSGPTTQEKPNNVNIINVKTAEEMLEACLENLPVDFAVCCAAVADWKPKNTSFNKIKKDEKNFGASSEMSIDMSLNPDILKILSNLSQNRPKLVIGFAAETENLISNAKKKLENKSCDWILANDVSANSDTFGSDNNQVTLLKNSGNNHQLWSKVSKALIAERLMDEIAANIEN
tara:strand:+ start:263 stop:1483 length:1221 start_codon:yes stop_codon:yes gene_type:complete